MSRWPPYWLRVWGACGLLYVWEDRALSDVLVALRDERWRVREMACKGARRRRLDNLLADLGELQDDPS